MPCSVPTCLPYAGIEPGPEQEPLKAFFRETFKSQPLAHWEAFLAKIDCCWAPRPLAQRRLCRCAYGETQNAAAR